MSFFKKNNLIVTAGLAGLVLICIFIGSGLLHKSTDINSSSVQNTALEAQQALARGDFKEAEDIITAMFMKSKVSPFGFSPFTEFIELVPPSYDPNFLKILDAWVAANPQSPLPYLVRAEYLYRSAWGVRGRGFASGVSSENFQLFRNMMGKAQEDYVAASRLMQDNPYLAFRIFEVPSYFTGSADMAAGREQKFRAAAQKFSDYYPIYAAYLHLLTPRWGGTTPEMFAYIQATTKDLPPGSALRFLKVDGYTAYISEGMPPDTPEQNWYAEVARFIATPEVAAGINDALALYKVSDHYAFNEFFIDQMAGISGTLYTEPYAMKILQLAGPVMGADNYAFNQAAGDFFMSQHDANAAKLAFAYYMKAMAAAEKFPFPDEAAKNSRRAEIYGALARASALLQSHQATIAFGEKAHEQGLRDPALMTNSCAAYVMLKTYEQAEQACTSAISAVPENTTALYWRAVVYDVQQKKEAAIGDYRAAMPKASPALAARMLPALIKDYTDLGRFKEAIAVYGKNPQLFNMADPHKAAKSYDELCGLYMKINQPQAALDYCNSSLSIEDGPSAKQKQRQLMKTLKIKPGK